MNQVLHKQALEALKKTVATDVEVNSDYYADPDGPDAPQLDNVTSLGELIYELRSAGYTDGTMGEMLLNVLLTGLTAGLIMGGADPVDALVAQGAISLAEMSIDDIPF